MATEVDPVQRSAYGSEKDVADLRSVERLVNTPGASTRGPGCDIFASALIVLQCFRGGRTVMPPGSLETLHVSARVKSLSIKTEEGWAYKKV